ncbi:phospholipase [Azospirillum endophyticum]
MPILSTLGDLAGNATAKAKAAYQTLRTGGRMAAETVKSGMKEAGSAVMQGDFRGAAKRGAKAAGQTLTDDLANHFRKNSPVPAKNPTIPCAQAEIDAKAKRVAERQALINEAREKKVLPQVTERFARDNKAVERARLAADVYHHENGPDSPKTPPPGWSRLSDNPAELRKYGLVPSDLDPGTASGFRAELYVSDPKVFGSPPQVVLVPKGTTFTAKEDWVNNLQQGIGLRSDYYERTIQAAQKVKSKVGPRLEMAGHSLGGGLATAGAVVTDVPCTTFNTAGLKDDTVAAFGKSRANSGKVTNYQVGGEVLTTAQNLVGPMPTSIGKNIPLEAVDEHGNAFVGQAAGKKGLDYVKGTLGDSVTKHGMAYPINALEKQKRADEGQLRAALRR